MAQVQLVKETVESGARIIALLEYDPITALFRWKKYFHGKSGWFEATNSRDYKRIQIDGTRYKAHRIAWLLMTGAWPITEIKFNDGDGHNLVFSNLYENHRELIPKAQLTQEKLNSVIAVDFATGLFRWVRKINPACVDGWFAGKPSKGHFYIGVFGQRYPAHHIIWFLAYGSWPYPEIDHENGNGLDNRLENLREVTHQQNMQNCKLKKNNTSGVNGVYFSKGRWFCVISVNGKSSRIGTFENKEDATKARQAADIEHNYHPNHGKQRTV